MKKISRKLSLILKIKIMITLILFFSVRSEAQLISTASGNGIQGFNGDNIAATSASMFGPMGICSDSYGNTYIADAGAHRIRKITFATGIITTVAGNGTQGYNGDNIQADSAELDNPYNIAVDVSGNIFIADQGAHRIRKVTFATGIITTIAGNGTSGYNGDNIQATSAELNSPWGLALDASGNIYIGDVFNARIRKIIVSTGVITTIAGTGISGYNGDNIQATSAKVTWITGILIDAAGNIYFSDMSNNRVRKITVSTGIITTAAGTGVAGYNGNNIQATSSQIYGPMGLCKDSYGNIYFADVNNNRIRKITLATGIITTIAGNGTQGYNGDNIQAVAADLNLPYYVFIDNSNKIYIADYSNFRIRQVTINGSLPIELINFEVTPLLYSSKINWTTASEINNDFFTLERTPDGINYSIVNTIKGAGNSNQEINYSTDDSKPLFGLSYYRLKQTDYDGKFSYSKQIPLLFENTGKLSFYPNPCTDIINITGDVSTGVITDISGKIVRTFQEEKSVSTSHLSSGIYFLTLQLKNGETVARQKIIKQ